MEGVTPTEKPTLRGWDEIASAFGVSVDTAQRAAARNVDPLPMRYDAWSRPYILRDCAQDWMDRNDHGFATYQALRKHGELPSQKSKGKPKRRRRPVTR